MMRKVTLITAMHVSNLVIIACTLKGLKLQYCDVEGILMALESGHTDVLGISLVHGNVVRRAYQLKGIFDSLLTALLMGMRWRLTMSPPYDEPACVCRALTRLRGTWPAF